MMKPTPAALATPRRMTLTAVSKGRIEKPMRVLLYGPEGVGKSTFGANAPNPIFLCAEDGTSELDVARFPEPQTWLEALDAIDELANAQHSYGTLVIDTLDWLEPLCWAHTCARSSKKEKLDSIEDFGFGKGYTAALDDWRVMLAKLERLRAARRMHIIMLAHSQVKTFKDPESEGYDRYELKLNLKAGGAMKEWCDAVLFARYETFTTKDKTTKRVRGVSNGARVIHTERVAAYDAKNRYNLPPTMPLDWLAFAEAVAAQRPASPDALRARIESMLEGADEALATKVRAAVSAVGDDAAKLAKYADTLSARLNIAAQENAQ